MTTTPRSTAQSSLGTAHTAQAETLASTLAANLRGVREALVARWLERITARVAIDPDRVFPTNELLNHVPLLIDGIADYLEHPDREIDAETPVMAKAMELGALRHQQGFDAYQILKEHELLGGIVFAHLSNVVDGLGPSFTPRELTSAWQRVAQAIEMIRQATMTHFLRLSAERVHEREERLRRFNRMVSHELKNRVGAIRGAAALLSESWLEEPQRARFQSIVADNAEALVHVLRDLESLSRVDSDARQRRNVLLPQAVAEVTRQLRAAAEARGVEVRIADDLPGAEVDAAAVELCLVNYLSNAIKYSDPAAPVRWVEITAALQAPADPQRGELVVRVRDNGRGVPEGSRASLFEQYFRAHGDTITGVEGTGLGLSIVRDTAESFGGRAWAEFPEEGGAVFAFSLPSRRAEDAAAAGVARAARVRES